MVRDMEKVGPLLPIDATDKLVRQFGKATEMIEDLMANEDRKYETVAEVVRDLTVCVTDGFCAELETPGQRTVYLTDWYTSLRDDCAGLYDELRHTFPGLSRETINQANDLQILNGIRRGVHQAMVKSQRAHPPRYSRLTS